MTKKEPIDHTGYQLDRKALNIDAGMVGNAIIDKVFAALDDLDMNHDQKSDVAELAPFVIKAAPFIQAIAPLINLSGVKSWLATHPEFFTDAKAVADHLTSLETIAAEAAAKLK